MRRFRAQANDAEVRDKHFTGQKVRAILLIVPFLMVDSSALAESPLPSFADCLPPISGSQRNPDKCSLTYHPPPLIRQDVKVSVCNFLPGQSERQGTSYKLMFCSVSNRSDELIESFRYGVRYLELGNPAPLVEAGFEGTHRFSTANIDGNLQPGEERILNFIGPAIPNGMDLSQLDLVVEVLGVYVPGSRALR